eukprot:NODE_423_length_7705_cov_0.829871.p6 type:complete len:166 gc:universal NODE_423_length_7705_cov_0.829871:2643-2146(-)
MNTLLLSLLSAVSVDCKQVIQFATELDIKYTNTDYFVQYEQDCCLGFGVICENNRVTELHWGFASDYQQATYPDINIPSSLRVLDMAHSTKSMLVSKLPDSLKVLNFRDANFIKYKLNAFPNLTYFEMGSITRKICHICQYCQILWNILIYGNILLIFIQRMPPI